MKRRRRQSDIIGGAPHGFGARPTTLCRRRATGPMTALGVAARAARKPINVGAFIALERRGGVVGALKIASARGLVNVKKSVGVVMSWSRVEENTETTFNKGVRNRRRRILQYEGSCLFS